MKIIILQHINIEDPGYIKDLMVEDGVELTTVELDEGQKIPSDLSKDMGNMLAEYLRLNKIDVVDDKGDPRF